MIHPHDTVTFTQIYNEYFTRLFHYAQKFVSMDDAADVLSDVFMGLWRSTATFENDKALATYLYRSVRNACLNQVQTPALVRDIPDIPDEPAIDQSEIIGRVLRAIDELPARQRQIIEQHWLQGKPFKDIDGNYLAVKSNNAAAIKALRKLSYEISPTTTHQHKPTGTDHHD